MYEIIVVYINLNTRQKLIFQEAVINTLKFPKSKIHFIYDYQPFRDKILEICKNNTVENTLVLHYGDTEEAFKVSKLRQFFENKYKPEMCSTASSQMLENYGIKYSTSLINDKKINNNYLAHVFKDKLPYVNHFWMSPSIKDENVPNLQMELLNSLDDDLILLKKRPDRMRLDVISNEIEVNTNWILTDSAVHKLWKKLFNLEATISDKNPEIIILSNENEKIYTTSRFLESCGLLQEYNPNNNIVKLIKNHYGNYEQLTRQLLNYKRKTVSFSLDDLVFEKEDRDKIEEKFKSPDELQKEEILKIMEEMAKQEQELSQDIIDIILEETSHNEDEINYIDV